MEYINIVNNNKITQQEIDTLVNNSMLRVRPELWIEWDFIKNEKENLDIFNITYGNGKKAHWVCKDCKSEYSTKILHRSHNSNCPYCTGQKINHTNSLLTKNPKLASEWHPIKNNIAPNEVAPNTHKKFWWLGKCGHEWNTSIANRNRGTKCPYCTNTKVLRGYNDVWTVNPELAKLLANPEDGYNYSSSSERKVNWKCKTCKSIVPSKIIANVNKQGLSCSNCSDGISYGEKVLSNLLSQLSVQYISEKTFDWSENKRYDFFIPEQNCIIEVHGSQHYCNSFRSNNIEDELLNDKYKENLALTNDIEKYIVINASRSEIKFIKNSILESELFSMYNLTEVDWNLIESYARTSLFHNVIKLWNENYSCKEIAEIEKIHICTVRRYLRRGEKINICNYSNTKKKAQQLNLLYTVECD